MKIFILFAYLFIYAVDFAEYLDLNSSAKTKHSKKIEIKKGIIVQS